MRIWKSVNAIKVSLTVDNPQSRIDHFQIALKREIKFFTSTSKFQKDGPYLDYACIQILNGLTSKIQFLKALARLINR